MGVEHVAATGHGVLERLGAVRTVHRIGIVLLIPVLQQDGLGGEALEALDALVEEGRGVHLQQVVLEGLDPLQGHVAQAALMQLVVLHHQVHLHLVQQHVGKVGKAGTTLFTGAQGVLRVLGGIVVGELLVAVAVEVAVLARQPVPPVPGLLDQRFEVFFFASTDGAVLVEEGVQEKPLGTVRALEGSVADVLPSQVNLQGTV